MAHNFLWLKRKAMSCFRPKGLFSAHWRAELSHRMLLLAFFCAGTCMIAGARNLVQRRRVASAVAVSSNTSSTTLDAANTLYDAANTLYNLDGARPANSSTNAVLADAKEEMIPPVKQSSGLREKHLNAASLFLLQPTERGAFTNLHSMDPYVAHQRTDVGKLRCRKTDSLAHVAMKIQQIYFTVVWESFSGEGNDGLWTQQTTHPDVFNFMDFRLEFSTALRRCLEVVAENGWFAAVDAFGDALEEVEQATDRPLPGTPCSSSRKVPKRGSKGATVVNRRGKLYKFRDRHERDVVVYDAGHFREMSRCHLVQSEWSRLKLFIGLSKWVNPGKDRLRSTVDRTSFLEFPEEQPELERSAYATVSRAGDPVFHPELSRKTHGDLTSEDKHHLSAKERRSGSRSRHGQNVRLGEDVQVLTPDSLRAGTEDDQEHAGTSSSFFERGDQLHVDDEQEEDVESDSAEDEFVGDDKAEMNNMRKRTMKTSPKVVDQSSVLEVQQKQKITTDAMLRLKTIQHDFKRLCGYQHWWRDEFPNLYNPLIAFYTHVVLEGKELTEADPATGKPGPNLFEGFYHLLRMHLKQMLARQRLKRAALYAEDVVAVLADLPEVFQEQQYLLWSEVLKKRQIFDRARIVAQKAFMKSDPMFTRAMKASQESYGCTDGNSVSQCLKTWANFPDIAVKQQSEYAAKMTVMFRRKELEFSIIQSGIRLPDLFADLKMALARFINFQIVVYFDALRVHLDLPSNEFPDLIQAPLAKDFGGAGVGNAAAPGGDASLADYVRLTPPRELLQLSGKYAGREGTVRAWTRTAHVQELTEKFHGPGCFKDWCLSVYVRDHQRISKVAVGQTSWQTQRGNKGDDAALQDHDARPTVALWEVGCASSVPRNYFLLTVEGSSTDLFLQNHNHGSSSSIAVGLQGRRSQLLPAVAGEGERRRRSPSSASISTRAPLPHEGSSDANNAFSMLEKPRPLLSSDADRRHDDEFDESESTSINATISSSHAGSSFAQSFKGLSNVLSGTLRGRGKSEALNQQHGWVAWLKKSKLHPGAPLSGDASQPVWTTTNMKIRKDDDVFLKQGSIEDVGVTEDMCRAKVEQMDSETKEVKLIPYESYTRSDLGQISDSLNSKNVYRIGSGTAIDPLNTAYVALNPKPSRVQTQSGSSTSFSYHEPAGGVSFRVQQKIVRGDKSVRKEQTVLMPWVAEWATPEARDRLCLLLVRQKTGIDVPAVGACDEKLGSKWTHAGARAVFARQESVDKRNSQFCATIPGGSTRCVWWKAQPNPPCARFFLRTTSILGEHYSKDVYPAVYLRLLGAHGGTSANLQGDIAKVQITSATGTTETKEVRVQGVGLYRAQLRVGLGGSLSWSQKTRQQSTKCRTGLARVGAFAMEAEDDLAPARLGAGADHAAAAQEVHWNPAFDSTQRWKHWRAMITEVRRPEHEIITEFAQTAIEFSHAFGKYELMLGLSGAPAQNFGFGLQYRVASERKRDVTLKMVAALQEQAAAKRKRTAVQHDQGGAGEQHGVDHAGQGGHDHHASVGTNVLGGERHLPTSYRIAEGHMHGRNKFLPDSWDAEGIEMYFLLHEAFQKMLDITVLGFQLFEFITNPANGIIKETPLVEALKTLTGSGARSELAQHILDYALHGNEHLGKILGNIAKFHHMYSNFGSMITNVVIVGGGAMVYHGMDKTAFFTAGWTFWSDAVYTKLFGIAAFSVNRGGLGAMGFLAGGAMLYGVFGFGAAAVTTAAVAFALLVNDMFFTFVPVPPASHFLVEQRMEVYKKRDRAYVIAALPIARPLLKSHLGLTNGGMGRGSAGNSRDVDQRGQPMWSGAKWLRGPVGTFSATQSYGLWKPLGVSRDVEDADLLKGGRSSRDKAATTADLVGNLIVSRCTEAGSGAKCRSFGTFLPAAAAEVLSAAEADAANAAQVDLNGDSAIAPSQRKAGRKTVFASPHADLLGSANNVWTMRFVKMAPSHKDRWPDLAYFPYYQEIPDSSAAVTVDEENNPKPPAARTAKYLPHGYVYNIAPESWAGQVLDSAVVGQDRMARNVYAVERELNRLLYTMISAFPNEIRLSQAGSRAFGSETDKARSDLQHSLDEKALGVEGVLQPRNGFVKQMPALVNGRACLSAVGGDESNAKAQRWSKNSDLGADNHDPESGGRLLVPVDLLHNDKDKMTWLGSMGVIGFNKLFSRKLAKTLGLEADPSSCVDSELRAAEQTGTAIMGSLFFRGPWRSHGVLSVKASTGGGFVVNRWAFAPAARPRDVGLSPSSVDASPSSWLAQKVSISCEQLVQLDQQYLRPYFTARFTSKNGRFGSFLRFLSVRSWATGKVDHMRMYRPPPLCACRNATSASFLGAAVRTVTRWSEQHLSMGCGGEVPWRGKGSVGANTRIPDDLNGGFTLQTGLTLNSEMTLVQDDGNHGGGTLQSGSPEEEAALVHYWLEEVLTLLGPVFLLPFEIRNVVTAVLTPRSGSLGESSFKPDTRYAERVVCAMQNPDGWRNEDAEVSWYTFRTDGGQKEEEVTLSYEALDCVHAKMAAELQAHKYQANTFNRRKAASIHLRETTLQLPGLPQSTERAGTWRWPQCEEATDLFSFGFFENRGNKLEISTGMQAWVDATSVLWPSAADFVRYLKQNADRCSSNRLLNAFPYNAAGSVCGVESDLHGCITLSIEEAG